MSICSTGLGHVTGGAKPLAVTVKTACRTIGVGNTKMYQLINEGMVKTIAIGRRRLVVFASLEALVSSKEKSA